LVLERLVVAVGTMPPDRHDHGILGGSTLYQVPWEISWDRGTVTLNATTWPDRGEVSSLPLYPNDAHAVEIDGALNGVPLRMVVDTGATFSVIPQRLAERLALHDVPLTLAGLTGAGGPFQTTGRMAIADLSLGSRKLPGQVFVETNDGSQPVLGLSALAYYDLQIQALRISFKARNPDMRATAMARIGRWPWMPTCRDPGCVRGHVQGSGDGAQIVFEFEADLPRPVEILFGCAEGTEPDWLKPWGLQTGRGPPYRHVRFEIDEARVEMERSLSPMTASSFRIANIEKLLVRPNGEPCRELLPLDVAPVRDAGLPPSGYGLALLP
jgi:Aspartyl protease